MLKPQPALTLKLSLIKLKQESEEKLDFSLVKISNLSVWGETLIQRAEKL